MFLMVLIQQVFGTQQEAGGGLTLPEATMGIAIQLGDPQRVAALARLGRSLVKHRVLPRETGDPAGRSLWSCRAFFRAYGRLGDRSAAGTLAGVAEVVRRSVRRHLPLWTDHDSSSA